MYFLFEISWEISQSVLVLTRVKRLGCECIFKDPDGKHEF